MPHREKVNPDAPYRVYQKLYSSREVTAQLPVFAKEIDALRAINIDAKTSDPAWGESINTIVLLYRTNLPYGVKTHPWHVRANGLPKLL
jgi:hypothetical protein